MLFWFRISFGGVVLGLSSLGGHNVLDLSSLRYVVVPV